VRLALHAEWTKLRTLPSTGWLLLAAVGLTVLVGFAGSSTLDIRHCEAPFCYEDTTKISLIGVRVGQVAVIILAVLTMTSEYGTRMITATLAAMPGRLTVLAGKVAVITALSLAAGLIGVAGSLLAARAVLPGNGFTAANGYPPLSLGDDLTLRAALGSVVYLVLLGLLGLGLGAIVRDTAGAVTVALMLLFGPSMLALVISDERWQHRIHRWSPMDAGLTIQATRDLATTTHIGPWAGLGVLAAYAGVALVGGAVLFRLRDA
jgi:ABC-2 type transport system permease protein